MTPRWGTLCLLVVSAYSLSPCRSRFHIAFELAGSLTDISVLAYTRTSVSSNISAEIAAVNPATFLVETLDVVPPSMSSKLVPQYDAAAGRWYYFFLGTPFFSTSVGGPSWRSTAVPLQSISSALAGAGVVVASGPYDEHYIPSGGARSEFAIFRAGAAAPVWEDITQSVWEAAYEDFPGISVSFLAPPPLCHLDFDPARFPSGVLVALVYPCDTSIDPSCGFQLDVDAVGVDGDSLFVGRLVVSTDGGLRWARVREGTEPVTAAGARGSVVRCSGRYVFWESGADGSLRAFEPTSTTDSVTSGVTNMRSVSVAVPGTCVEPRPVGEVGGGFGVACVGGGGLYSATKVGGELKAVDDVIIGSRGVVVPTFTGGQWVTAVGDENSGGGVGVAVAPTLQGPWVKVDGVRLRVKPFAAVGVGVCCPVYCGGDAARGACEDVSLGGVAPRTTFVGSEVGCGASTILIGNASSWTCAAGGVARAVCFDPSRASSLNVGVSYGTLEASLQPTKDAWDAYVGSYPGGSVRSASEVCTASCTAGDVAVCDFADDGTAPLCSPCLACSNDTANATTRRSPPTPVSALHGDGWRVGERRMHSNNRGLQRQSRGGATLFMLCNQTTADGIDVCLKRAVCSGVLPQPLACTIGGRGVACPSCVDFHTTSSSKKGLLGLLGLIPLACLVVLCVVAFLCIRQRKEDVLVGDFMPVGPPTVCSLPPGPIHCTGAPAFTECPVGVTCITHCFSPVVGVGSPVVSMSPDPSLPPPPLDLSSLSPNRFAPVPAIGPLDGPTGLSASSSVSGNVPIFPAGVPPPCFGGSPSPRREEAEVMAPMVFPQGGGHMNSASPTPGLGFGGPNFTQFGLPSPGGAATEYRVM